MTAKIALRYARSCHERASRALDLRPHPLDQLVVLDARRARGHARHAAEAAVEVRDHLGRDRLALLVADAHQHDAPARRVHLVLEDRVGRARRQAEAAVHAVLDQVRLGRRRGGVPGGAHIPPTKAPGRKIRAGSKRAFRRSITTCAGPAVGPLVLDRVGAVEHRAGARRERLAGGRDARGEVLAGRERDPRQPERGARDDGARRRRRGSRSAGRSGGRRPSAPRRRRALQRAHRRPSRRRRRRRRARPARPRTRPRTAAGCGPSRRPTRRRSSRPRAAAARARAPRSSSASGSSKRSTTVAVCSGSGMQPHGDRGDQPERPERAREQLRQVIARDVLDHLAAGLGDGAVAQHHGRCRRRGRARRRSGGAAARSPPVATIPPIVAPPGSGRVPREPLAVLARTPPAPPRTARPPRAPR